MKKVSNLFAALLFVTNALAISNPGITPGLKQKTGISFTENKGQVHDQYYKPRPDILYGATTGNMVVHIKNNGVSYQLNRVDKYTPRPLRQAQGKARGIVQGSALLSEGSKRSPKHQQIAKQTIYRVDLTWLNHNTNFTTSEDEALPGYNNYYLESCPNGALNVLSYKGITLHNLYNGINLHYYEKAGELKHDYIVSPHADYKQIQLQVAGAAIGVNNDGTLLLTTPLGVAQEGAPLVYQNAKPLKAQWVINKNTLSFDIENYDPSYELIIDPVTRLWGTYYGDSGDDYAYSCTTDAVGNVYMSGFTESSAGTIIATTGSHQSTLGGNIDAFLAKFNTSGVRQWATYYGGLGDDYGNDCATDNNNDVYLAGTTDSQTGTVMATAGSHQPAYGGMLLQDAYLVKFNASGVRQWATYYGGTGSEEGTSCATDGTGNVYLSGYTDTNTGTAVGTAGSHQPANGGGLDLDAYLVKFNSAGVRQWGTYYGATGFEIGSGCATDAAGNVYLSGLTDASAGTAVATVGSHQPAFGGGFDGFLVKFNTGGLRQWGTYYGGTGAEFGISCATDAGGNVYMTGFTDTNIGTAMATAGSHQASNGGGSQDAYLVKFNTSGVRQWGTYYGGAGDENVYTCTTDAIGNVFISGNTDSNVGTVIATAGSHQTLLGGGVDAYFAKFNTAGVRQWGTYYGGSGDEYAYGCAAAAGGCYLAGETTTSGGTVIATTGSHQGTFGGGFDDGFLVKFDACTVPPAMPSPISGPTSVCAANATSYSTAVVVSATSYTWSLPPGWAGATNNNTILATPGASGIFTLVAGNDCGASPQRTLNVTVNVSPTVTVNNGTICAGQSFTIVPGGATSYTYTGGGPVVSPAVNTTYTVIGLTAGCTNTAFSTVMVNPLPTLTVNNGAICTGKSFTIVPTGASNYTYSGGPVVSPTVATTYTITGVDLNGCADTALSTVMVNALPTVTASTSHTTLCAGKVATLTAGGALNYTFMPGAGTGSSIVVTQTALVTYTVTGVDINGCSNTAILTQSVNACVGVKENTANQQIKLYPNPTTGVFNLELDADNEVTIFNALGQVVYAASHGAGNHQINLEHLAKGIYVVKLGDMVSSRNLKLVKE